MHFHWQNLNDDKTRPHWGGGARHGRAWLHWGQHNPGARKFGERTLGWCWSFFDGRFGPGFKVEAERGDGVGLAFAIYLWPFLALWVHLHGGLAARIATWLLPTKVRDRHTGQFTTDYGDREVSVQLHGGNLRWRFWCDPNSWSNMTPKWRDGHFDVIDFLFGRTQVTDRELQRQDVLIPMPERAYKATVVIEDRVWRRPRWPFAWHRHLGAHVHMEADPVPFPGKGENSWDCGEDATYSSSFPVPRERFTDPVSYAIGQVVASALDTRRRHGGRDWRPKEDHRPKEFRA